jgi:hypothetical protein
MEFFNSEDQTLWKMTKRVMRFPTPSPPLQVPEGLALSYSEKAEALADSLEGHFHPVDYPSDLAITVIFKDVMRAYQYEPACKPTFTSPSEVLQANSGPKVGKALGPNSISSRVLRRIIKCEITFLTKACNAVLRRQYFPPAQKHFRVVSILKPEMNPTLPSSYRPTSLLGTVGKFFEMNLLPGSSENLTRASCCVMSSLNFDPDTAYHCIWSALMEDAKETSTGGG